jgi:hypothetical protein
MTVSISSSYRIGLVAGTGVTISGPAVPAITTDDIFNPNNPTQTLTQMLAGISSAQLVGSATINALNTGNIALYTVPLGQIMIPTDVVFALTAITGSGDGPAINVGMTATSYDDLIDNAISSSFALSGGSVFAAGSGYVPADVLTLSGGTHSVAATVTVTDTLLASVAINAIGTGYAPNDTITLAGGTAVTKAILNVLTTKLASVALNAPGTVYNVGDTITLAGGTHTTAAILTVSTVQLVSAAIGGSGGTGYGNTTTFNVTVAGGTGSPAAVVNVTSNSGGVVTTINSISTPGSYTVLPTLANNLATGGTGTGLELNLVFGVATFSISTAGSYTVNTATFTQASTTGSGAGATFNNGLYGINTISINNGGDYTANASSFSQFSTSGAGSAATFNTALYGVEAFMVDTDGDYSVLPTGHVATTGGSGTGATLTPTWTLTGAFADITTVGQLLNFNNFVDSGADDGLDYTYLTTGQQLTAQVVFPASYSSYQLMVYVFGFSTTAP